MEQSSSQQAWQQLKKSLNTTTPIVIGILLAVSFLHPLLASQYDNIFSGHVLIDPLAGLAVGGVSLGIPIISYVTGGELLREGVSLLAVTAFIFSWTAVGLAMLPLESAHLGKRFAYARNSLNVVITILFSIATVTTVQWLT